MISMDARTRRGLTSFLSQYVSQNKIKLIADVLQHRTRYVTLVLEDIYKEHNASATLRTCECLGVQDIHIIEKRSPFAISPDVVQGSSKWVTLHRYRDRNADATEACFDRLRARGYCIIATTPRAHARLLDDLPLDSRLALVFGNEEEGLSEYALRSADAHVRLPMFGFTRSYNISVSVAIALSSIVGRLHGSDIDWHLSDREKSELTLAWYRSVVRRSDLIEKKYLAEHQARTAR
jgi:tRNA (guanosine-2'-O-)-methyltransferase